MWSLRLCRSSGSPSTFAERADVRFHVCVYPLRVFRDDVVQEQVRPVE
jgi:hypothetical protein